jgi:hypothetical protein
MKRFFVITAVAALSLMLIGIKPSFSQNVSAEDEVQYALGDLILKSATEISLSEINYETEEEMQATYLIDSETLWDNIRSIDDIKEGDEIEVFYREVEGKKKAMVIAKSEVDDEDFISESDESLEEGNDEEAAQPAQILMNTDSSGQ